MDLWIVAAAAGAGYAAKVNILKNSTSRTLTCSCDHSQPRNLLQQIRNRTCPFCRLAAIKRAATSIIGEAQNDLLEYTIREEVGSSERLLKSIQLKKRSNGYNILKPVNFSESWLTSELYAAEDYEFRLEDYAFSSPSTDMEKSLTIGSLISRRSHDFRKDMELEEQTEASNSHGFSNNDLLHFFVGIAIGMMLIIAYNRKEVEYLNQVLKKNENLVHDLYQELEMNDNSTLKELANDSINEQSLKQERKNSTKFDVEAKNSEAMSKIEAELEAELERLELTMKSSTLGRNFDFIQEDFNQDKVDGEADTLSDLEYEASGSSSDQTEKGIYAVSPQELSLRLHKVIQARLTAQIIQLEAALEDSHKRLLSLE